jgi:nitrogen regulatory protein PII-like uncharacterized protein
MKKTVFILILLLTSNLSLAQRGLSPSNKWMYFYYQNPQPDKLIENVRAMSNGGQLANIETAGVIPAFLSRVFAQNPGRIDQWINSLKDLPQNELYTLYNALWLSNTNEGRSVLKKTGLEMPGGAVPDLLTLEVTEPMLIDALWGYFMATGHARVVRRVISGFNYSKYQGADERYKSSKQTDQDKQEAYKAVIFEAAKASLIDNCLMHPVALATCEKLLKENELNRTERLWLGVTLAKVSPEKYKFEIRK